MGIRGLGDWEIGGWVDWKIGELVDWGIVGLGDWGIGGSGDLGTESFLGLAISTLCLTVLTQIILKRCHFGLVFQACPKQQKARTMFQDIIMSDIENSR